MKKIFFLTSIVVLSFFDSNAKENHNDSDFILFKGKDTTFCYINEIKGAGVMISVIVYTDEANNKIELKGPNDLAKVVSLRCGGYVMDYMPLNPEKPDGKYGHMYALDPGKIRYYDNYQIVAKTKDGERQLYKKEFSSYFDVVKLDNGKMYKVNGPNVNDIIVPYLKKCSYFNSTFKEENMDKREGGDATPKIYYMVQQQIKCYNKGCP